MGTTPANFPPENVLEIGKIVTGSKLAINGPMPSTVFITAPTTGLYDLAAQFHFVASDGLGTFQAVITLPHSAPVNVTPSAPGINADIAIISRTAWLNAGDQVSISITIPGVGATVYNAYLAILRVF